MIESVIAVLVITSVFLCLFKLSHLLTGKILMQHAAMRVERARSVGFNDFMCRKSARVSVIPVSGKRIWPGGDELDWSMENARIPIYMNTANGAIARGVLEYEHWSRLMVEPGDGHEARVRLKNDWFTVNGKAAMESNFSFYMNDEGR